MNLFVTDYDPIVAAFALDDKRVTKIALEAAQVMSTVLHERGVTGLYKPSHEHSGVTVWCRTVPGAMGWTATYGLALCGLYTIYGRKAEHASRPVLLRAMEALSPYDWRTPAVWQNSARNPKHGADFTHIKDVRRAYREYLNFRWPGDKRAPVWTGRKVPRWVTYGR